jgi:mono/diheme cytochrome c family protein
MRIITPVRLLFLIFCILSSPALLHAQENHCAVKKSPYRLSMDSGKKVYTLLCVTCHQADGLGIPKLNPPLTGNRILGDKETQIGIVIRGVATQQEKEGVKYPKAMPPNPDLNDREIADVLTYIRNSFGNKASAVKVSDVKSARSKLN